MTDNRTTELLRKLLEERGLSCQTHYLHASWRVGQKLYGAVDNLDGTLTVDNLTPEQAIAATLGGDDKSRWHELFGTPEKAARTLTVTAYACDSSIYCGESDCIFKDAPSCPPNCGPDDYDALLEWLRGDA